MKYFNSIFSLILVIVVFSAYYFLSNFQKIKSYLVKKIGEERGQIRFILYQRLLGIFFFGFIPLLFLLFKDETSLYANFLKIQFNFYSFLFVSGIGLIVILVNYFASRSADNLSVYPQIRTKTWSIDLLVLSALSWMAYLFAYEFLFRGVFLFSCIKEVGNFNAILLNIFVYALVHIPKGKKEAIGAIPLGIVLCLLTIHSGTMWIAFWIHCCLALSNEWFSIRYHPEIRIKFKNILD